MTVYTNYDQMVVHVSCTRCFEDVTCCRKECTWYVPSSTVEPAPDDAASSSTNAYYEEDACPHCGEAIEGRTRRYFNWVEIDEPPRGDVGPVFLIGLGVMTVVVVLLALLAWWIRA